jgi:hypothetical protein
MNFGFTFTTGNVLSHHFDEAIVELRRTGGSG